MPDIDIDGWQYHLLPSQWAKDIACYKRLKASGWSVLRQDVADVEQARQQAAKR